MKRLALVLTVLMLLGVSAAWATDATTDTTKEENAWQDFAPNPYEKNLETAEKNLQDAYDKLESLYNTFNFDQLITAYYAYARCYSVYMELKKRFDAYEKAFPFKLVLRVVGLDLRPKPECDYALSPNEIEDQDEGVAKSLPVLAGVKAKITLLAITGNNLSKKSFDTNEKGYLGIKHFIANQKLIVVAEADGYLKYASKVTMDKSKTKVVRLEVLHGALKGVVYGLPPMPPKGIFNLVKKVPIAGATLTFVHTQTKRTWTTQSSAGHWRKPRTIHPLWKPGQGRYYCGRMLDGEYEATVTAKGFRPFKAKMNVKAGKEAQVQDFVLVPEFEHPLGGDDDKAKSTAGTSGDGDDSDSFDDPLK